jgi:glycosyltransferase involved in cell wall biosynthesis
MTSLSIIIPTHRRPQILKRCLEHIAMQTIAKELEVIVVSDGPDEEAQKIVRAFQIPNSKFQILFFSVPKSQQGQARNEGVKHATADRVLFIGDDIFLAPDACERHMLRQKSEVATQKPIAILGFTTWDPAVGITPVMQWLEKSGWQFGYPMLKKYEHDIISKNIQHQYTYTSHISLPAKIARDIPFRTDVTLYGWEDIEWGMRLRDAGVQLLYEPSAKALHHHRITLEDSLRRMETLGRSAKELAKKIKNFDRVPIGIKLLMYTILSMFPTIAGRHRKMFLLGIRTR